MTRGLGMMAVALMLTASALGLAACGASTPSRNDFITQIRRITNPPLDRAVAGCAYDELQGDQRLLKLATTASTIPSKDSSELSRILARCILDGGTTTTTTAPKKSSKKSSSKKSTKSTTTTTPKKNKKSD